MPSEVSAGAVIFRETKEGPKFLLLHYVSGHWEFVKGHVEKGEDDIATLKREAAEETGIKDLRVIEGFKHSIDYFYRSGKQTIYKKVNFYLAETATEEIKISYEHQGFEWLSYGAAMERLTFKNAKETLRRAKEFLGSL